MGIRRIFLTGLIIVLPVIVTYWLIAAIFRTIDGSLTPVLTNVVRFFAPGEWLQYAWVHYISPLVSVTLAFAVVYLIGLFGGNVLGRQVLRWLEGLVMRIPVVRSIYSATRQFVDTFSRPEGTAFHAVVLVEFPRAGAWALGLVAAKTTGEVAARLDRRLLSVFVPTTPNPTGGYLIFVPEAEVIRLSMSIDDALKMIISGGVLTPETAPRATTLPGGRAGA